MLRKEIFFWEDRVVKSYHVILNYPRCHSSRHGRHQHVATRHYQRGPTSILDIHCLECFLPKVSKFEVRDLLGREEDVEYMTPYQVSSDLPLENLGEVFGERLTPW